MIKIEKRRSYPYEIIPIGDCVKVAEQTKLFYIAWDGPRPLLVVGVVPFAFASCAAYIWAQRTSWLRPHHAKELKGIFEEYVSGGLLLNIYLNEDPISRRFARFFGFQKSAAEHPEPGIEIWMRLT